MLMKTVATKEKRVEFAGEESDSEGKAANAVRKRADKFEQTTHTRSSGPRACNVVAWCPRQFGIQDYNEPK